jgi:hypothetical protein
MNPAEINVCKAEGEVFCIISENDIEYNTEYVYVDSGRKGVSML